MRKKALLEGKPNINTSILSGPASQFELIVGRFPPEALMRNSSTICSLARESSRTLAAIASGSAGTETAEDREPPSTPLPDTRSGKGLVSTSLDPAPKRAFVIEQDSDLDAGQQLPEPTISTLHGNESEGGESVHGPSRVGLRPRTPVHSPERDNRFPRTGSHTESSSSSDVEMNSGEEDMSSVRRSSPPRYVSPVRRDDLAAVLLAGPSHVEFDPQLATRIAEQHASPLGIRPPVSVREPRRGPIHTRENVAIRSPTASSSGSHGPPASPRRHNPSKRKRKESEAGPSHRRRIIWSPLTSDSDGGNGGDESDGVGFRDSDSEAIGNRTWTTSDQEHVVNCLKSKEGRTVQLPVSPWVRARRLLVPSDRRCPLAALYMRGDLQFIHHSRL